MDFIYYTELATQGKKKLPLFRNTLVMNPETNERILKAPNQSFGNKIHSAAIANYRYMMVLYLHLLE